MQFIPQNIKFLNGIIWLIRLRWLAAIWVAAAAFTAFHIFGIPVRQVPFYCVALGLLLENGLSILILKWVRKNHVERLVLYGSVMINSQISLDFLFLSILMHYSGGIENPIFMFFIFHLVISAIMLKPKASWIQATFAMLLLWLIAYFEYSGILEHNNLWVSRVSDAKLYKDPGYLIEILSAFTIASYLLVYMTNYIMALLRKQERAYEEANMLLEQQDKIKDEYISRVTHNIKGPLAAIQSSLTVVHDKIVPPDSPKYNEFIEVAYNRTNKLIDFINKLLRLIQIRLSDSLETEEFSLKELLVNTVESVKANAQKRNVTVYFSYEAKSDKMISDPLSLEEVFLNLLSNAIKYNVEGGKITCTVTENSNYVQIEIADTGIGISASEQERVFTEFFRGIKAKRMVIEGTGLGLTMVKDITERLGGLITLKSNEGSGSSFQLQFPQSLFPD